MSQGKKFAIASCTILGALGATAAAITALAQGTPPVNPPVLQPGALGNRRKLPATAQPTPENWGTDGKSFFRTCEFENPAAAARFIEELNRVGDALDHHADFKQDGSTLEVLTTTHDTGGLTQLDYELARSAGQLLAVRRARCVPERLSAGATAE